MTWINYRFLEIINARKHNMWLKILGLMMQGQGFRSLRSSLTVDTKAAVNSPTFLTTGTLAVIILTINDLINQTKLIDNS